MSSRQFVLLVCSTLFLPHRFCAQQVTLQPWVEVYGTVNGQQLGKYVTGITPSANLPYKAAVSKIGNTGIYRLNSPSDTSAQKVFLGENLLTADLNNDGLTDVVVGKTVNNYDTVYVYWGTAAGIDTLNPLKIPGENQFDGLKPGCVGDVNNDGKPDLVLLAPDYQNLSSRGRLYVFLNPVTTTPAGTITGDSVNSFLGMAAAVGDLNNDGFKDLTVRGSAQRGPQANRYDYVTVYWGIGMDTLNLTLGLQMRTRSLVVPGLACFDVNGDGRDDLLWTTADSTGQRFVNVHFGRTNFDTIPDMKLVRPFPLGDFGYTIADAGDMNGDGYHDIIVGAPFASIANGYVIEYSAGSLIDREADAIVGKDWDGNFGQSIGAVGDLNGDGLADIIVGGPRYAFLNDKGYWGIFLGDSTIRVTDVRESATNLPQEFSLTDAYPNPFNPTTTIAFGLRSTAHVTIIVFDQLGREVRGLVSAEYSPGNYTTQFDASGLSSGIYYYRMTVTRRNVTVFQQTKHFTLLK